MKMTKKELTEFLASVEIIDEGYPYYASTKVDMSKNLKYCRINQIGCALADSNGFCTSTVCRRH